MPDLKFDWEAVKDKAVVAVLGRNQMHTSDCSLAWDALALVVDDNAIVLTVTADTDEIVVSLDSVPDGDDWKEVSVLADVVGSPLGWCWVSSNYRGYRDSFVLAYGQTGPYALEPRLTILAEACSLSCYDMKPRKA